MKSSKNQGFRARNYRKYLRELTGVSTTTMSRLSKDENVSTEILSKICSALGCDVGDIITLLFSVF